MFWKAIPAACLLLIFSIQAQAFEVDGFRSGIRREDAEKLAQHMNLAIFPGEPEALSLGDEPSCRAYILRFCKDRLVSVQKSYPTDFKTFVKLAADMEKSFGAPTNLGIQSDAQMNDSDDQAHGGTKLNRFAIYWNLGEERAQLDYAAIEKEMFLFTEHETQNDCSSD